MRAHCVCQFDISIFSFDSHMTFFTHKNIVINILISEYSQGNRLAYNLKKIYPPQFHPSRYLTVKTDIAIIKWRSMFDMDLL